MLLDQGAQGIVSGVELREPGVLAPQLLGFVLDLLRSLVDLIDLLLDLQSLLPLAQDRDLGLSRALLDQPHALLVSGIPSPVESR
jgi:hypothetical protein